MSQHAANSTACNNLSTDACLWGNRNYTNFIWASYEIDRSVRKGSLELAIQLIGDLYQYYIDRVRPEEW